MFIANHKLIINVKRVIRFAGFCVALLPGVLKAQQHQTVDNGDFTNPISFPGGGCVYNFTIDQAIGYVQTGSATGVPSFKVVNNTTSPVTAHVVATPISKGFAYIVNSNSDKISVINASTQAVIKTVGVGKLPTSITVSPNGKKAYVVNNYNRTPQVEVGTVTVIDALTNTASPQITVGNNPVSVVVSPDGSKVYVIHQNSDFITVIDGVSNAIVMQISGVKNALSAAISADGEKLFVAADGFTEGLFYVIQTSNNQVLYTLPVGLKPSGCAATPDGKTVYVTNSYSNKISVINVDERTVKTLTVGYGPYGAAMSPDGKTLYIANSDDESKSISVINTLNNTVSAEVSVPSHPFGIAVSPDGEDLYITCSTPHQVFVMNTATHSLSAPITVDPVPVMTGNFVSAGIECSSAPVYFTITVNPSPSIIAGGNITSLTTVYGQASPAKSFTVAGNSLRGAILVTPPPGFEVSTDSVTFTDNVSVLAAGSNAAVPVYLRLKASAVADNNYSGNVTLTSSGANAVTVTVQQSTVNKAQLTITATNKSKLVGDENPFFTVTYSGFVNGDDASALSGAPVLTTTATKSSGLGVYPIIVTGAVADNYVPVYVNGQLNIISGALVVPSAFTPNDDGVNDTWDIRSLNLYPKCTLEIFNRYGRRVYRSAGYSVAWDGKQNGVNLPAGTYYYIINLNNGEKPVIGYVAVVR